MTNIKLWLVFLCIAFMTWPAQAQENLVSTDAPYPCPFTDTAYYQAGTFPRFNAQNKTLDLVNETGEVLRVLDAIEQHVRIINWSPDCRYLTGAVGQIIIASDASSDGERLIAWSHKDIVIWDATTGGRVHTFENNAGRYLSSSLQSPVIWQPDAAYALVLGGCFKASRSCFYDRFRVDHIWRRDTNQSYRVGQETRVYYSSRQRARFNLYYWDMARGLLWGSGIGAVTAYDLNTGQQVRFYPAGIDVSGVEVRFRFSADNTLAIVYGTEEVGYLRGDGIVVYDIATSTPIYVNDENFGAANLGLSDQHPVALSADNRYLIAGFDAIRVWDIQNLPENIDERLPIYRHGGPNALIDSLRFSDWGVIETTSADGVQHWDLHSGAFIPSN